MAESRNMKTAAAFFCWKKNYIIKPFNSISLLLSAYKIADFKKAFEVCEGKYEMHKDIADTYQKISKEDYVSSLIEEQKKRNRAILN